MALTGSGGRHNGICPPPFAKDHLPLFTFGHDLFAKCQEQCRTSQQWGDVIQFARFVLRWSIILFLISFNVNESKRCFTKLTLVEWAAAREEISDNILISQMLHTLPFGWRVAKIVLDLPSPPLFKVVPMPSSSLVQSASHWAAANISHGQWSVDTLRWRSSKGNCTITNLLKKSGRSISFDRIMCGMRRKYLAFEHLCGQEPVWASLEVETS